MDHQGKKDGAERLATFALFVIMFAIPFSRAAVQIVPIAPLDSIYFGYHAQILQLLFILGAWRAGFFRAGLRLIPVWLTALVAVWLVGGVIGAASSAFPMVSLVSQSRWIIWAAFAYAIFCYFRARPERCAWALELYAAGFIGFALVLHFLIFANQDPDYSWVNGILGFGNVRHFGFYAMTALVAANIPLIRKEFNWRSRRGLIQLFGVTLCWTMLFWSGGRSPMLAIAVTVSIFAALGLIPHFGRLVKMSLATVALAVPWSLLIAVPDPKLGLFRVFKTAQLAGTDAVSSGRLSMWWDSIEKFAESPLVGFGPGLFPQTINEGWGHFLHPHNIIIQALFEWGILGGLPFLIALAALAYGILRWPRRSWTREELAVDPLAGALIAVSLMAASFLDGSLFHPFPLMIAAVGAAIFYSRGENGIDVAGQPRSRSAISYRTSVVVFSGAVMLTLIGILSTFVLAMPGTPPPDGTRVAVLKRFPVSLIGPVGPTTVARWTDEWAPDIGRRAVVAHLDWARGYAAGPEVIATLDARRACASGQPNQATAALETLAISQYSFFRAEGERITKTLERLWPECNAVPEFGPDSGA